MRLTRQKFVAIALAIAVLLVGAATVSLAGEEGDAEVHMKIVRKVIVDCDETSGEDCEHQVHIQTLGDSHVVDVGGHEMVWVAGGDQGVHFATGHGYVGEGGFLGIQLTELTPELRSHFGVAAEEGVMVSKVVDDSAAFRAGLAVGDIITRIDGETMGSSMDLIHAVRSGEEGESIAIEVWRDGSVQTVAAVLDGHEMPAHLPHQVFINCADDDEDCAVKIAGGLHHVRSYDCPEGEECEIEIKCTDGDCDCSIDGDPIDCEELHEGHSNGD